MSKIKEEILGGSQRFMKAFNANKPELMGEVYTDDAKLYPAGSPIIEGRGAIESFWKSIFEMGITKAELTTNEVEGFGDTAIEEGGYALYSKENELLDTGKYVIIWKKINDQWKYHKDIWNTNISD